MALQKDIVLDSGVTANYLNIDGAKLTPDMYIAVCLAVYYNAAARAAGKLPITWLNLEIGPLTKQEIASEDLYTLVYAKLKEKEPLIGAVDC